MRVNLSKEEKRNIGKPSTPRPEIDLVAYDVVKNTLYLLEAKSFLDSHGVHYDHITEEQDIQSGRYKLLTSKTYRDVLSKRLLKEWRQNGIVNHNTKVRFGLMAGKVYQNRESDLAIFFKRKGWLFWGPTLIKKKMKTLAEKGYENNAVTIAAKLLLRK